MIKKNVAGSHCGILRSHKKEGVLAYATLCLDLEDMMLSEMSWSQKDAPVVSHP